MQKGQNVKNIKSKIKIKAISLVLSLLMLMPSVTGIVSATTEADALAAAGAAENTAAQTEQQAESHLEVLPDTLDISTVPEIVGTDAALAAGHIQRAYAEEKDLYTVMFKNPDGTRTAYYYNHPVKYIDTDGSVKDITLGIEANGKLAGSYVSKDTLASTLFPQRFTDGIALSGEGVSLRLAPVFNSNTGALTPITPITPITPVTPGLEADSIGTGTLTPVTVSPTAELKSDGKTVVYEYDAQTRYEYSLTYSGFKEDIIVSEYTGQTEYTFTLYTNGLTLTEDDGDFCLTDSEGNIKATLGSIIIFTADQQNNTFGSMTAETVTANEEYILTIHIDEDYLADPATLYPITIDPTIEISYANNGAGAIQDIVVNSADPLSGTDGEISAGKWGSDQSISRILMKFPHLNLNGIPYSESITSATVYIHDLMCQHEELTLECYPFIGPSWSESNATWSNTNQTGTGILGPKLSQHIISYANGLEMETSQCYGFDITAAVQGWKSGTYDQAKGIIFKASSANESATAHNYKTFASYNRANHKPYLVVGYDSYIPSIEFTMEDMVILRTQSIDLGLYKTVVPENATVTYTALDHYTSVDSVSGALTPRNIGNGVVRASITVNGITYSDTVNVHIVLTRTYGVYKLNSVESEYNLDVCDGKISGQVAVNHWQDDGTLKQLWRIKHIGKGQYTIRPMHNPNMLLTASGTSVYVVENTTDDASLLNTTYAWKIDSPMDRENRCIQNAGITTTTNTLSVSYTDYSTCLNEYVEVQEYGWMLTSVSYTPRILLYDTVSETLLHDTAVDEDISSIERTLPLHDTKSVADLGLRVIYSSVSTLDQEFEWRENYSTNSNSNSHVEINASTGEMYGTRIGRAFIYVEKKNYSPTCLLEFEVLVILSGEYYIKNKETGKFVDIQDEAYFSGQQIEQMTFDGGESQKWDFVYRENDGYYEIIIRDGANRRFYLSVKDSSTANDASVVLRSTLTDGALWKVAYTESGAFKITPKTGEANNRVLAVGAYVANVDGVDIEQRDYVNDENYKDEWMVEDASSGRSRYKLMAYNESPNIKRDSFFAPTGDIIGQYLGYSIYTEYYSNCTKDNMKNYMSDSEIFIVHTHGKKTGFMVGPSLYLTMSDLSYCNLDGLKFALLLTCKTGEGFSETNIANNTPTNIIEKMVCQGAETVVGFTNTTTAGDCNRLAEDLLEAMLYNGLNLQEAMESIDYNGYQNNMNDIKAIAGNKSLYLH